MHFYIFSFLKQSLLHKLFDLIDLSNIFGLPKSYLKKWIGKELDVFKF
jgi:hypothetical protein